MDQAQLLREIVAMKNPPNLVTNFDDRGNIITEGTPEYHETFTIYRAKLAFAAKREELKTGGV